jgi:hypothetical protein
LRIGLLVGAGAGFIGGTMTGNKQIDLPAETVFVISTDRIHHLEVRMLQPVVEPR